MFCLLTNTALEGKYAAMESYIAKESDEISLPQGTIVDVLKRSVEGWWTIRYVFMVPIVMYVSTHTVQLCSLCVHRQKVELVSSWQTSCKSMTQNLIFYSLKYGNCAFKMYCGGTVPITSQK